MDPTVLQFYQSRRVFNDAFHGVIWDENQETIEFVWKDVKDNYANYLLIKHNEDDKLLQRAKNWKEKGTNRKIITTVDPSEDTDIRTVKIEFFGRPKESINFPDFEGVRVKEYTLGSRNKDANPGLTSQYISELLDLKGVDKDNLDRFAGAIMHLQDGSVWLLKNDDELVLSAALVSKINESLVAIEFIVTRKRFLGKGYGGILLQTIIHYNQKYDIIANKFWDENNSTLFENFGFTPLDVMWILK